MVGAIFLPNHNFSIVNILPEGRKWHVLEYLEFTQNESLVVKSEMVNLALGKEVN